MNLADERAIKMKMRDVEAAFKYRRIPYPKRSIEIIALLAISCTFLLYLHTNKLNNRLKDMEVKLQPTALSGLALSSSGKDGKLHDEHSLQATYHHLKSTGQRRHLRDTHFGNHNTGAADEEANHLQPKHQHKHHQHHKQAKGKKVYDDDDNASNENAEDADKDADDEENSNEYAYNDDDDDADIAADANKGFGFKNIELKISTELKALELNNTRKAEVELVIFNRVPKVGSQSLMQLMSRLGKVNGFEATRDKGKAQETIFLKTSQQKELLVDVLKRPQPHIYSQHIAYINFTRFHLPKPIYINLVRDPIERIISWHYYIRAEWYYIDMKKKLGDKAPPMPSKEFLNMDLDTCVKTKSKYCQFNQMEVLNPSGDHRRQTLFFCGQNVKLCMPFNSFAAMQKAKRTVEEDYAVVGSWEDTNITLTVLEHYIPKFFRNAKVAYYLGIDQLSQVNKNKVKGSVSEETKVILRKNLTNEIEFYNFCKQRLYLQYTAVTGGKQIDEDDYVLIPEDQDTDLEY